MSNEYICFNYLEESNLHFGVFVCLIYLELRVSPDKMLETC